MKGVAIDWEAARERILEERALKLATERKKEGGALLLPIVECVVASEHYGFEASLVREVLAVRDLAFLPTAFPAFAGILNVRGDMVAVLSLRKLFGLPGEENDATAVVILRNENHELGFLVDSLISFHAIDAKLQPPLATLSGMQADFLKGITREQLILLDGGKILADPRLSLHEEEIF